MHPLQLEQLGLTEAIRSNIHSLDENSDIFFSIDLDDMGGLFSKKQELNIYRISQEVLSNIIKHSNAKACKIELKKTKDAVLLRIEDNGNGFDFSEEFNKLGSLGLKTLKGRVQQLNGTLVFDTQKGEGTMVKFTFPF